MRKLVSVLLTLAVAVSLMVVPAVTSADGAPTIDGVVTDGEWDGAVVIPVTSGMGNVSVIAYTDYLYVLFNVTDSTDARLGQNLKGNDQTSININPTDGGSWGFPYDLIFEISADLPWNPKVNSGIIDGWNTRWFPNNTQEPLPGDLESATIYSGGKRITEWKLPLATINPSPGDTLKVGGAIEVGDGNSYVYPIGLVWDNASTYADILIPGNTAVSVSANTPEITAINVDPTSIDFGTVKPGDVVSGPDVTVENIGTVKVVVDASLDPLTGTVFNYLRLKGSYSPGYSGSWDSIVSNLLPSQTSSLTTQLDVPSTYSAQGTEAAILIFEATAV